MTARELVKLATRISPTALVYLATAKGGIPIVANAEMTGRFEIAGEGDAEPQPIIMLAITEGVAH